MRALLLFFVLLAACGGGGPRLRTTSAPRAQLDPTAFLLEVGALRIPLLREDGRSIEELEGARDAARGADRRSALLDLARAHMLAAGASDTRAARRSRAAAERAADAAARGTRDADLLAQSDFIQIWLAYRAGDRNAANRAERFTTRRAQSGELALLVWVIRGELAMAAEHWADAIAAYRYVLGQLGHPLYAYALYRTAQAHEGAGDTDGQRQALEEAASLGCAADADAPTRRAAIAAAHASGAGTRHDGDVEVPATCPEPSSASSEEEERVWRPAE